MIVSTEVLEYEFENYVASLVGSVASFAMSGVEPLEASFEALIGTDDDFVDLSERMYVLRIRVEAYDEISGVVGTGPIERLQSTFVCEVTIADDDSAQVDLSQSSPIVLDGSNSSASVIMTVNGSSLQDVLVVLNVNGTFDQGGAIPGLSLIPSEWTQTRPGELPGWAEAAWTALMGTEPVGNDYAFAVLSPPMDDMSLDTLISS